MLRIRAADMKGAHSLVLRWIAEWSDRGGESQSEERRSEATSDKR